MLGSSKFAIAPLSHPRIFMKVINKTIAYLTMKKKKNEF